MKNKYFDKYANLCGWKATIVYASLCRHANKERMCFPSINKLAKQHNVSRNTILKGIKILEMWRIIKVRRVKNSAGKQLNNLYSLHDISEWKIDVHEVNLNRVHQKQRDYARDAPPPCA